MTGPAALARGRLVKEVLAEATLGAAARLREAEERAREIVRAAERDARSAEERALREGKEAASAELAAAWIKLRKEEASRDERELDRTVLLARAIAERLIGETLAIDPSRVVEIAKEALLSARRAAKVALYAHPDDAEAIRTNMFALGLEGIALEIHADPARARGSLFLDTDLGTLDANLPLQLDRLARALRNTFGA
ncbi:MAG TPA: FliH/SctL family protein [Polyangiaceae bacterium]|nr:FliH/SctL family protein [Polyangiaceae bacterium]